MKTSSRIISILLMACLYCHSLWAASTIEEITFKNDLGETIEIELNLATKIGAELNAEYLMADVNQLKESLPNFQNIVTTINPINGNEDQVEVIFEFQMKRTIRNIRIVSNTNLEIPTDIREKLLLQRESLFNASKLERDKKTISDYFIRQGFPKVEVEHEVMLSSDQTNVSLTYNIKPTTNRLHITDLYFYGNTTFDNSKLKKHMEGKPREFFLQEHPTFSLFQLDQDAKEIEKFYKENGFFDVKVAYEFQDNFDGTTAISISIEEGNRYRVKRYLFDHAQKYASPTLESHLKEEFEFNKMGYYSDKTLRKILQSTREFFGNRGHARVQVLSSFDSENEEVTIRINEGPVFWIRNVIVEGNEKLDTRKVLYDVKIKAGQQFNATLLNTTLKEMRETGFYSDVRVDFEPTSQEYGNIIIVVKEARTRTISFGAGTGTNGIMGEISFSDRNFLNSGKSVSLHLRRTLEMTKIGLVYRDPHLFETDYALKVGANYTNDDRDDFNEERYGAILMIEKKITENLKVGVGTRIEFLNLSDIDEEIRLADHNADGEDTIIGLVGTLFYKNETKDAAGDTKDGIRVKIALLPSYADQGAYIKTFATLMATKSLWENSNAVAHTISGRMTVGYTSENTPFYEKFYAGGASTLRGFKRKSIGSRDGDGGQVLVSGNLGYSFPIWQETVKGVVFLEAASVGDSFDDLGNFRAVGGLGVKANLMDTFLGSMIEAGVAIPLKKEDGDELSPFYFIFGDYDPAYDL